MKPTNSSKVDHQIEPTAVTGSYTPEQMDSKPFYEATVRGIGNNDPSGRWPQPYPDFGSNRRAISIPLSIQAKARKHAIFVMFTMKYLVYRWMLFLGKKPLP